MSFRRLPPTAALLPPSPWCSALPSAPRLPRFSSLRHQSSSASAPPSSSSKQASTPEAGKEAGGRIDLGDDRPTHFGFRSVPSSQKESLVGQVFSSVASSYDLMNDAMSLGIHRLWKDRLVSFLDPHSSPASPSPLKCLDVAGGTGDIALRILDHAREKHADRRTSVHVVDINPAMLEEGKKRFAKTMYHETPQVSFSVGNAQDLLGTAGVESESVDLYTIAFGIRNCTEVGKVLEEAFRVLKKGGRFSCLEFSKVNNPLLAKLYDSYSFNVIPNLGDILAADRASYQYLVESIQRFPSQPEFAEMIEKVGFKLARHGGLAGKKWEDLTWGVAAVHTGVKL